MVPVLYEANNGREKEGFGSYLLKTNTNPKKEKLVPHGNQDMSRVRIFKKAIGLHIKI